MRRKPDQNDLLAHVEAGAPLHMGNVVSFAEAADALRRQIAVRKLRALARRRGQGPGDGGNAA
jgi:hypothetical protein